MSTAVETIKLTDAELKEIFRKISSKERAHGGFLTCFAVALTSADEDNFRILIAAALAFVGKYNLWDYRFEADAIHEFPPPR
jgi:hypothetical protein